jgi:transcriptional regulator GlxA family with amidase domain
VLRAWIAEQQGTSAGWVSALRNPEIARALSYLHQRPHEPWTVDSLAREVGQSRATFNRRFVSLIGEPPASYLGRWRMSLAAHLLRHSELSLEDVAARVGYESAAALSKAFRRTHGIAPGRFRAGGDDETLDSDGQLAPSRTARS